MAARAASAAAWKLAPPGAQSTRGTAFYAKPVRPAEEIDQAIRGHIPVVSFHPLAVLGELIWASQQCGARAGGEEKDEKGVKCRAERPTEHPRQHAPHPRPQLMLNHVPEWPGRAVTDCRRGWLTRGAARAASAAAWKPAQPGAQSTRGTAFCAKTARPAGENGQRM